VLSGGYAMEERRAHARVVAQFHREEFPAAAAAGPNPSTSDRRAESYGR
jgi:hypothetical protein